MVSGAYAGQRRDRILGTLRLLQHYRAFLASDAVRMKDPFDDFGGTITKAEARQWLTYLIHMAINRKAGLKDIRSRKWQDDYQRGLLQDAIELNQPRLIIRYLRTPELRSRFATRIEHGRSV